MGTNITNFTKHILLMCFMCVGVMINTYATKLIEIRPLNNQVIMLHFDDGFTNYSPAGDADNVEYFGAVLDSAGSINKARYTITSNDGNYASAKNPTAVSRKSKTEELASIWPTYPYVKEHWVYLTLPTAMQRGKTYTVNCGTLVANGNTATLVFDEFQQRSDAIKVSQIGMLPNAGLKFGYLYQYMGSGGAANFSSWAGKNFWLVQTSDNSIKFTGTVAFRKAKGSETNTGTDFYASDVYDMNFSSFATPGEYKIVVDGVGSSYPFKISNDVYNSLYNISARGFYHHRSGDARTMPYSDYSKPVDHKSGLNGHIVYYSNWRWMDGAATGDATTTALENLPKMKTNTVMPNVYGGWFDAADYDKYPSHLGVVNTLMLMFEFSPSKFTDNQLNIPESGNGIPDIIDECKFEVDFFLRLKGPTGGISGGTETSAHPAALGSWNDALKEWYQYGEEPLATYWTVSAAAQLALAYQLIGRNDLATPYITEARTLYTWAQNWIAGHPNDLTLSSTADCRSMAAAAMYKLTGEAGFEANLKQYNKITSATTAFPTTEAAKAVWLYVTTNKPGMDATYKSMQIAALENDVEQTFLSSARTKAARFGSNVWAPTLVGIHSTTPQVLDILVAHKVTGKADYYNYALSTMDYFFGGNSNNLGWMTGFGQNPVRDIMHGDSRGAGADSPIPGVLTYGPWGNSSIGNTGWWGAWAGGYYYNSCYPGFGEWPLTELEFNSRYAPMIHEYTIWQNNVNAVAAGMYFMSANTSLDIAAPFRPYNLTAGTISANSIAVSWTAPADNVGATKYMLYLDGIHIGTTNATSYTFTGLIANTVYGIKIRAVDAAGNISQYSNKLKVSTNGTVVTDNLAPSVPANLSSSAITTSSFTLSWNASTDNVGVTAYDVYSGSTKLGTASATSYTVSGLAANTTYSMTVRAKDAAGNTSAASAPLNVATLGTIPTNNIALNKPVTASSVQTNNTAAMLTDGNTSTRWAASTGIANEWVTIDLGANYNITGAEMLWEQATWIYKYKIETSTDNANWTLALDKTNNTFSGQTENVAFTSNGKRYIKLTVTGWGNSGFWSSIFEMRVFGTVPVVTYTLTTNATNGSVAKSPSQTTYNNGSAVTLTATANAGYQFSSWSGDVTGTTNPVSVTMNANKNVTANFTLIPITGTNIALNKRVTASTQETTNTAVMVNDGNTATRWAATSSSANEWVNIDLGGNYNITGAEMVWEQATWTYKYKIETSSDNVNWTLALDKTNSTFVGTTETVSFSSLGKRYIKLTVTGWGNGGYWASIHELRVFGTSAATTGTGLTALYFNNTDLTGAATLTRTDATVNFDWAAEPASGIVADGFSVRWEGLVEAPVTGAYTFSTISDDGVRLWVNGVQVINNWSWHGPTTDNGTSINLVAGTKYDIKMEFFEGGGGAVAKLMWSYTGQASIIIPQSKLFIKGTPKSNFETESVTAINAASKSETLMIYPNPVASNGVLHISIADVNNNTDLNISIFDITGKLVKSELVQAGSNFENISLNINGISNGLYMLNIHADNNLYRSRLIVK